MYSKMPTEFFFGSSDCLLSFKGALNSPDGRAEAREDQPDPRLDQSSDINQIDTPLDKTENTLDGSSVNTGRPVERSALLKQSFQTGHSVTSGHSVTGHSVTTERSASVGRSTSTGRRESTGRSVNTRRSVSDSYTSKNSENSKEVRKSKASAKDHTKRHRDSHSRSSNGNTEDSSASSNRSASSSPSRSRSRSRDRTRRKDKKSTSPSRSSSRSRDRSKRKSKKSASPSRSRSRSRDRSKRKSKKSASPSRSRSRSRDRSKRKSKKSASSSRSRSGSRGRSKKKVNSSKSSRRRSRSKEKKHKRHYSRSRSHSRDRRSSYDHSRSHKRKSSRKDHSTGHKRRREYVSSDENIFQKHSDSVSVIVEDNEFDGESEASPRSRDTSRSEWNIQRDRPQSKASESQSIHSDEEDEVTKIPYADIIKEIFKILPVDMCPPKEQSSIPSKPRSGIDRLKPSDSKDSLSLPQSQMIEDIREISQDYISKKAKIETNWVAPHDLVAKKLGTHMKYYNLHREFFPANIPKLDRDASKLDLSDKTNFNVSPKFLESLETQARNVVSINSYADLFATAAFSSLSSEQMDANVLLRLVESLVDCIKHSTNISFVMATELLMTRRELAMSNSKILSPSAKDSLRATPISADSLFGGKISENQKANSETYTQKFIATSVSQKSKPGSSDNFKIPKFNPKRNDPKKDTSKPSSSPSNTSTRGGYNRPRGGVSRGRGKPAPSRGGASYHKRT